MNKLFGILGGKKLAIAVAVVFLIAGLGGFFAGQSHKAISKTAGLTEEELEALKKEEIKAEVEDIKETPLMERDIFYVDIGQMVIPVVIDGVTKAFLLTELKLEVYRPESVGQLNQMIPRLRDRTTQYFYGQARRGTFDNDDVNIELLGEGLRIALNTMIDEEAVSKVVFERLLMQPKANAQEAPAARAAAAQASGG